jgi:hypothetical protein
MATHTMRWTYQTNSDTKVVEKSLSGTGQVMIDESINTAETDKLVACSLDVSQVTAFMAVSDYAVTIETNSGSAPGNTLTLAANVPYTWCTGDAVAFALTVDVTGLYITNSSGSTATIAIRALYDATP